MSVLVAIGKELQTALAMTGSTLSLGCSGAVLLCLTAFIHLEVSGVALWLDTERDLDTAKGLFVFFVVSNMSQDCATERAG